MTNAELNTALYQKMFGKNNRKAERIEKDNKLRMDWNREVDRAVISEVPIEDILQIKREHITEPVKRSIERYGNKPEMLSLILNMAIAELVLLITKVLEAIRGSSCFCRLFPVMRFFSSLSDNLHIIESFMLLLKLLTHFYQ